MKLVGPTFNDPEILGQNRDIRQIRVVREPGFFGSGSAAAPGFSKFSAAAPAPLPNFQFFAGASPEPHQKGASPEPHQKTPAPGQL